MGKLYQDDTLNYLAHQLANAQTVESQERLTRRFNARVQMLEAMGRADEAKLIY